MGKIAFTTGCIGGYPTPDHSIVSLMANHEKKSTIEHKTDHPDGAALFRIFQVLGSPDFFYYSVEVHFKLWVVLLFFELVVFQP